MHRLGQRIKRDILPPVGVQDYAHGTTSADPEEARYLQDLRSRIDAFEGYEINERVEALGPETVFDMIGATAEELSAWERGDPEGFEKIKEARGCALALYEGQKGFPAKGHAVPPPPSSPGSGGGMSGGEQGPVPPESNVEQATAA